MKDRKYGKRRSLKMGRVTIIIAGIGNTIGIGQTPDEIPTEFPEKEKEEDELESFASLPGMGSFLEKLSLSFKHFIEGDGF
ncbi:hypothetical protein AKJ37_05550 [candidate division MSBL1 archaeon SCGC-AAA259I09]|uniref:Uncharacterized protein n=2 Tax=candidate division MSBL1 TaxID=215777 RepID=A0A133UQ55_9EURY|nr:hypothetical protein AKJ62_05045 [candidate division MSBL1 archaeon SCGC-AAA259D14]KXA96325.1 hypothetical protein AKJ37_05550 [candidate division MSBL1 archaeon SCGC-AAA259I09]